MDIKNHRQYIISIEIKKITACEQKYSSRCAVVNYTRHGIVFYGVNSVTIFGSHFNKHYIPLSLRHCRGTLSNCGELCQNSIWI